MKEGSLMRVLLCKIHCRFLCFSKPSLYTSSGPLKLEYTPSTAVADSSASDTPSSGVKEEGVVNAKEDGAENAVKSCIRKREPVGKKKKKRVRWREEQLAEIKEFESSEAGDTDSEDESSRCLCIIL